jgi:PAS domain S-box-containing protein
LKIFGYKRHEIVGQNIIKIIPSPFAESHDMYLRRYLDTGFAKVIDRPRNVLGLTREGYLLPFILCVKHIVDSNGNQSFLGVAKPVKETPSSGFIIVESDLKVKHFSKSVGQLFGTKPAHRNHHHTSYEYQEVAQNVTLTQWMPQVVQEKMMEVTARGGFKVQMNIDDRLMDLVLSGDSINMSGMSLYILKIKFKNARVESSGGVGMQRTAGSLNRPLGNSTYAENEGDEDGEGNGTGVSACPFSRSDLPNPHGSSRKTSVALVQLREEDEYEHHDEADVEASDEAMPMNFSPDTSEHNLASAQPSVSAVINNNNNNNSSMANSGDTRKKLIAQSPQAKFKKMPGMSRGVDIDTNSTAPSFRRSTSSVMEKNGKTTPTITPRKITATATMGNNETNNNNSSHSTNDAASDRGSVSSYGSRNTAKSSTYVKRVINSKNEASNTRLKWLHYSFMLCLVALVGLAIEEHVLYRHMYGSFQVDIDNIYNHAEMAYRMARICDSVRSIDLIRASSSSSSSLASSSSSSSQPSSLWWSQNSTTLDTWSSAKSMILEDTLFFLEHQTDFAKRDFGTLQLIRDDGTSTEDLKAMEALLIILASAQYVQSSTNLNDPNLVTQIQWVLNNAPTVVFEFLNGTIYSYVSEFEAQSSTSAASMLAKSTVGPVVCLVVILVMIAPLYVRLEETREQFLRMFYDIPKEVVKGIHESHYQRLLVLNEEDADDEDGGGGGEFSARIAIDKMLNPDGVGEEMGGGVGGAVGGAVAGSGGGGGGGNGKSGGGARGFKFRFGETLGASGGQDSSNGGGSKDGLLRYWNVMEIYRRDQHKLSLKVLLIFALTCLFFFISGGLTYFFVYRSQNLRDSVYWSSQRSIILRESAFLLRERYIDLVRNASLTSTSNSTNANTNNNNNNIAHGVVPFPSAKAKYPLIPDLLVSLSWVERSLLYGDSQLRLPGFVNLPETDFIYILETRDACIVTDAMIPSDCATFKDGLMSRGLRSGLNWYMRLVSQTLNFMKSNTISTSTYTGPIVIPIQSTPTTPTTPTPTPISTSTNSTNSTDTTTTTSTTTTTTLNSTSSTTSSTTTTTGIQVLDSQITIIRLLERSYLNPAVTTSTKSLVQPIRDYITWFYTFHISFTLSFIFVLALIDMFVVRKLVKALGEDLRRTGALVYMLPSEVLSTVPSFRRWVSAQGDPKRLRSSKNAGGGGGSGSGVAGASGKLVEGTGLKAGKE